MTDHEQQIDDPFEDEALSELEGYRDRLAPLGVLDGLSPGLQLALADRVWLFDEGYRRYDGDPEQGDSDRDFIRIQKVYRQKTPTQVRRLNRKLRSASTAVKALMAEIKTVRESENRYLAYQIDTRPVPVRGGALDFVSQVEQLAQLAHAVDVIKFPPEDASQAPTSRSLPTSDVLKDQAVSALYHLFTNECGLKQNEAEVRVAKIGNAFWGWNLTYREQYGGADDWKGSDAVRKRLARSESTPDK